VRLSMHKGLKGQRKLLMFGKLPAVN
jgi:hypothetical protein